MLLLSYPIWFADHHTGYDLLLPLRPPFQLRFHCVPLSVLKMYHSVSNLEIFCSILFDLDWIHWCDCGIWFGKLYLDDLLSDMHWITCSVMNNEIPIHNVSSALFLKSNLGVSILIHWNLTWVGWIAMWWWFFFFVFYMLHMLCFWYVIFLSSCMPASCLSQMFYVSN